jgi:hypothetical protein
MPAHQHRTSACCTSALQGSIEIAAAPPTAGLCREPGRGPLGSLRPEQKAGSRRSAVRYSSPPRPAARSLAIPDVAVTRPAVVAMCPGPPAPPSSSAVKSIAAEATNFAGIIQAEAMPNPQFYPSPDSTMCPRHFRAFLRRLSSSIPGQIVSTKPNVSIIVQHWQLN